MTGATGFVGRALCLLLLQRGWRVRAALRSRENETALPTEVERVVVGAIDHSTDWTRALVGVSAVVALASRVHHMAERSPAVLAQYRATNVAGTARLASAAAAAGVRRFVFASSIKVNGEQTKLGHSFCERDAPAPIEPYAISKWEAEQELHRVAAETGLAVVILRAPLVYGPEVRANFLRLLRFVKLGVPLPFGRVKNARSLLFVGNFSDAIACCLRAQNAVGETFLLSDGQDVSTPELLARLGTYLSRPARLLPVPISLLRFVSRITGKQAELSRLLDSLAVDSSKIQNVLGWHPPYCLDHGLRLTTVWYERQASL